MSDMLRNISVGLAITLGAGSFAVVSHYGSLRESVNSNSQDVAVLREFRIGTIDRLNVLIVANERMNARIIELEQEQRKARASIVCMMAHVDDEDARGEIVKCITETIRNN